MRVHGFGLGWVVGSYQGRRLVMHAGGYPGAASLVAFLPDEGIGVAAAVNGGHGGGELCAIVAVEVFHRLLDLDSGDELSGLLRQAEDAQADLRRADAETASSPVHGSGLSRPAAAYAGAYVNEHWGTVRITAEDGGLSGALGELAVELRAEGADRFQLHCQPRAWRSARFEVTGGQVAAVVLTSADGQARFARP